MAARRRNVQKQQQQTSPPKSQRLEEFDDTCDFFASQTFITPAFSDPRRVLLRRVFFLNEDRTKYVSVGFYPTRDYRPQVEFGAVKLNKSTVLILVNDVKLAPNEERSCHKNPRAHVFANLSLLICFLGQVQLNHMHYIGLDRRPVLILG